MILIEFVLKVVYSAYFYTARFIVWFITARDCKHCQYGQRTMFSKHYRCSKNWRSDIDTCMESVYRKNFKRDREKKIIWKD